LSLRQVFESFSSPTLSLMNSFTKLVFDVLFFSLKLLHFANLQLSVQSLVLTVLDANAGIPSGLLEDQFTSVGDYKQCISIQERSPDESFDSFTGQYCFLTFTQSNRTAANHQTEQWIAHTKIVNRRFPFSYGLCIPSLCSKQEVAELFQNSTEFGRVGFQDVKLQYCQVDVKKESWIETFTRRNTLIALWVLFIFFNPL